MDPLEGLSELNLDFVEDLYARYLEDPSRVEPRWREIFARSNGGRPARPTFPPPPLFRPRSAGPALAAPAADLVATIRQARVARLVEAFRRHGHLIAQLDPLGTPHDPRPHPELDLETYGLTGAELAAPVLHDEDIAPFLPATIGQLHGKLVETYSRHIGVELGALDEPAEARWLQDRMERSLNRRPMVREQQRRILERLVAAEAFEHFLHTKYVGTKRFSLEGAESLIPLLDLIIEGSGEAGVEHIVIGMPHRGRLNVLVNVIGKDPTDLLTEFEDVDAESTLGAGDVKYHLGYSSDYTTLGGKKLHLSLSFNPSHLEAVDPIVLGRARGKQDRLKDDARRKVLPVLLHGDAAFAGQGLVAETLNLANLKGYRTGGTIHVVVNNQIGFTTSPRDSRSTIYATDVALASHCPIFHVNGEDPEAVAQVCALAVDFRTTFQKDVVIDMYCYRKYGHNEADEPSFTQPLLYRKIDSHASATTVYAKRMIESGALKPGDVDAVVKARQAILEDAFEKARIAKRRPRFDALANVWQSFKGGLDAAVPDIETGVARERLLAILGRLVSVPPGFHAHPKIRRLLDQRAEMARGKPLDWGTGEALAFGSLVAEGYRVRISGQDSRRGTFSHRHAVLTDIENGAEYTPLANIQPRQGDFSVFDSALSELGVLGFDYGYAAECPDSLVVWEAQFGDFANGAQVLIDQFISSAEDKWKRLSGITLLLPHGYEGQGPEHSSARLERWLQLCAEDNMQVCQPTTPAQIYHLLRRQLLRPLRKPLVVLTPKSLLRHPNATSSLDDLTRGRYERLLGDPLVDVKRARRVLVASGKIYYELLARREKLATGAAGRSPASPDVALVRLEQLYPLPSLESLRGARDVVWVQDEPLNMGAWSFLALRAPGVFGRAICRAESASPATGSAKAHAIEQEKILSEAFA